MKKKNITKVAVYIRVSTHEQASEGYSIKAQKTRLEHYAMSQGWEIVQFYVDEGISAKDMNRPELQRMLKGVKEKLFDCVLVYRLDRLTRSVIDLHEMIETFEKYDVKFKSSTEVYDTTTATGRLFITLVAAMAQWERENLGERVRFGMEQKAKEGKWVINVPPFGYEKDGDNLIIKESEAIIVRTIFSLYATGKKGANKIAEILNEKKFKTKSGKHFTDTAVLYILKNPLYKGTMRYNYRVNKENYFEIPNAVPSIVNNDTFEKVQSILKTRSSDHPKRATSPFIFSGVVRCHRCKSKLAGKYSITHRNGKKYVSYQYYCTQRRAGVCDQPTITQNYLEHQFLERIKKWNIEKELKDVEVAKASQDDRVKNIMKELENIERRKKKWQYAWANDMMSDNDFKNRMYEENEKEQMLNDELNDIDHDDPQDIEDAYALLFDMLGNWKEMNTYEKKHFVRLAVKEMSVDKIKKERKPSSVAITNLTFH